MKVKKLLAVAISIALLASSSISASAVEKISTRDFYMNGYRMYGSLTLYESYASGYTYCEKENAKISAHTKYIYMGTDGVTHIEPKGKETPYDSIGYDVSAITDPPGGIFDYYLGAMTESKVQLSEFYYSWSSEGTDTELRMGYYAR